MAAEGRSEGSYTVRWTTSDGGGGELPLGAQPVRVGSQNAEILLNLRGVSRQHLVITLHDGRVNVTDMGSRNGAAINGLRLQSRMPHAWQPGDTLVIPGTHFELRFTPADALGDDYAFSLTATPSIVRPGQRIQLALRYGGAGEQPALVQGYALKPGLKIKLGMDGSSVRPGDELRGEARIDRERPLWLGGTFIVRFSASAGTNDLVDSAQVTVRVRPRYELLLLLLLLLLPVPFIANQVVPTEVAQLATATGTATATSSATLTETTTATSSATSTPTLTWTPLPTNCFVSCPAGWSYRIVQQGETLFSIAQQTGASVGALAQANCIADPNRIFAGQAICAPPVINPPTLPPTLPPPTVPPTTQPPPPTTLPPPTVVPTTAVQLPDLVVRDLQVNDYTYFNDCTQIILEVSYTVSNIGNAPANDFYFGRFPGICDYRPSDEGCATFMLRPGTSSAVETVRYYESTVDPDEGQRLEVRADADIDIGAELRVCDSPIFCRVQERNENNNSQTVSYDVPACIAPTPDPDPQPPTAEPTAEPTEEPTEEPTAEPTEEPLPDLVVSGLTQNYLYFRSYCEAALLAVSYTVSNVGDAPADGFYHGIQADTLDGMTQITCPGGFCRDTALEAGDSITAIATQDVAFGEGEAHSVTVYAEADIAGTGECPNPQNCRVVESSEANNRAGITIDVPACFVPDLAVSDLTVGLDCASDGLVVAYSFTVTNQGAIPLEGFRYDVFYDYPDGFGTLEDDASSGPLEPGGSRTLNAFATIPVAGPVELTVSVSVFVDATSEGNLEDNFVSETAVYEFDCGASAG
jgi:LysM repeat protein